MSLCVCVCYICPALSLYLSLKSYSENLSSVSIFRYNLGEYVKANVLCNCYGTSVTSLLAYQKENLGPRGGDFVETGHDPKVRWRGKG